MELNNDRRIDPVCKFGPGGDYSVVWPPGSPSGHDLSAGALTRFLASLADIAGVVSGVARGRRVAAMDEGIIAEPLMETLSNAAEIIRIDGSPIDEIGTAFDAPTGANAPTRRFLLRQSVLFADDKRTRPGDEHQPKHRVRTPRRTAKKRLDLDLPGQGTLFEIDLPRLRTA
jgi:hypothetical protein